MERLLITGYAAAGIWSIIFGFALIAVLWALGRIQMMSSSDAQPLITDDGPELHSAMPAIEGPADSGEWISTRELHGREFAILFLSAGCGPCEALLRDLRRYAFEQICPVLVVLESGASEAAAFRRKFKLTSTLILDEAGALRSRLGIDRTPYGFLVDELGAVRMKGVVNDGAQVQGLIDRRGHFIGADIWTDMPDDTVPALET
ncbi:MAG TPA: redoxin domain-containing protein [Chthonomonadales bacterium]|nr:redoxin domain-containing protein [Chthonomonadales bacterium]